MRERGKIFISICPAISLLLVAAWMLCCMSTGASAKEQPAASMRKSTSAELTLDDQFNPPPGSYYYDVYLNGVRIGKATTEVKKEGDEFHLQIAAKIRSIVGSLYKIKYRGQVAMTANPLQPIHAVIEEETGSKNKKILMEFPQPNRVVAVQIEAKDGKKPKRTEKEFDSESFVFDPFSTAVLLRNLKWQVGATEIFDIFTGRKEYELKLFCRGETVVEIDGRLRDVWEIVLQTRSLKEPREVKLSGFVICLSKDSSREILKITGSSKYGRIGIYMRKYDGLDE